MARFIRLTVVFWVGMGIWTSALAADRYLVLPLSDLTITNGSLPTAGNPDDITQNWRRWSYREWMRPYAVLDGPGEAFIEGTEDDSINWRVPSSPTRTPSRLMVRLPEGAPASGRLYLPKADLTGMVMVSFKIPDQLGPVGDAENRFRSVRHLWFLDLSLRNLPGGAWFRHQVDKDRPETTRTLNADPGSTGLDPEMQGMMNERRNRGDLDDTFSLMLGGQAVAENLQLDRQLNVLRQGESTVDIATIDGITIAPMEWKALLAGAAPKLDPLAAAIPADQHALFFPTFSSLLTLMDEADANGTPLLSVVEQRSQDALTRPRLQRQLCLPTGQLSRLLGPTLVASVAFTGSDPYLRAGSDVAVLFEARDPGALIAALTIHQTQAAAGDPAVQSSKGETDGVAWQAVRSPDRSVCSYLARIDKVVVVTNSPAQLEAIVKTLAGKSPALAGLDEYRFFRARYALGDAAETALLVISDGAIRRWCGPRWRIGDSRRVRAASALAELQARRLDGIANGLSPEAAAKKAGSIGGAGTIAWTDAGPVSSIYGSLSFMTPIAELDLARVTPDESTAYGRFRDAYQQRWGWFFDPIALRFGVAPDRLRVDLSIMPLILGSDYREFMSLTAGAKFDERDGDPHAQTLAHFILAINPDSPQFAQAGNLLPQESGLRANPLAWIGNWLALYADEHPIWEQLAAKDQSEMNEQDFFKLPIVLQIAVRDPLKLTFFLTSIRAMTDQTAPGLSTWTRLDYNGQSYVRVAASESQTSGGLTMSLCYAATPRRLIVALQEDTLKSALDRLKTGDAQTSLTTPLAATEFQPWLGRQLGLQLQPQAFRLLSASMRNNYQQALQQEAWSNLPILNEWHRRLAQNDPVAYHEKQWGTRLVDPAGGRYVWNDEWQTMESTVFGHPGQPKADAPLPTALTDLRRLNLGITFENNGLRARAEAARNVKSGSQ